MAAALRAMAGCRRVHPLRTLARCEQTDPADDQARHAVEAATNQAPIRVTVSFTQGLGWGDIWEMSDGGTTRNATPRTLTGGCLCGATRYEIDDVSGYQAICHCRMCQRASGGAFIGIRFVPGAHFRLTKGHTHHYASTHLHLARLEMLIEVLGPLVEELEPMVREISANRVLELTAVLRPRPTHVPPDDAQPPVASRRPAAPPPDEDDEFASPWSSHATPRRLTG